MDTSAVQKVVKDNIEQLKKELGLTGWDITFKFESLGDGDLATCIPSIEYQHAVVTIDPNQMNNKVHILHVMLHELLHCITSSFVTYRLAVARLIDSERAYDAVSVIYSRAEEEIVSAFARILEK